jgi:hypothetical protein
VTPGEELTIHVGGGGSSYAEPTAVNVTIESSATPGSPGGAGHPDLPAGVGVGGTGGSVGSSGRAGGPGFVSIRYSS